MISGVAFGLVLFTLGLVLYARSVYQSRERARLNRLWLAEREAWYQATLEDAADYQRRSDREMERAHRNILDRAPYTGTAIHAKVVDFEPLERVQGERPARLIDMLGRGERMTISGVGPKGNG